MKYILIFLSFITFSVSAQDTTTLEQDSIAFRTYLSDNIGTAMNVERLMSAHYRLAHYNSKNRENVSYNKTNMGTESYFRGILGVPDHTARSWGGKWSVDNARFPDSLRIGLIRDARAYREGKNLKAEKARLVDNLRKFDAVSTNKPIFFATIYSEYKGDIEKYVDDLYSKSIMGSKWRMTLFCRWPSAKKLQNDLSVQFAIGLALYDLWIKQSKEEMAAGNE